MRVLNKPYLNKIEVFNKCCSNITSSKKTAIQKYLYTFLLNSSTYENNALNADLYLLNSYIVPIDKSQRCGDIKEFKKLYSNQMVPFDKPARYFYDKLMSLAPLGKCPYCSIGQVSTLDHYLPKSIFPVFSILPNNLVASCKDCNTGKSTKYAKSKGTQTLHPYYDNFSTMQWLFARVLQTTPVSIEFYVSAPMTWSQIEKDRIKAHFDDYNLAKRFSIEASNTLANLREEFDYLNLDSTIIQQELDKKAKVFGNIHKNSWETAMYQALSQDNWYCNGGYSLQSN